MRDEYPLHLGDRRFSGPLKYAIVFAVLTTVAFLYVAVSRWLEKTSADAGGHLYDPGHPFPESSLDD